jgi:endonuclease YncB( thermonuclease family)
MTRNTVVVAMLFVAACGGDAEPATTLPAGTMTVAGGATGTVVAVLDGDSLRIDLGLEIEDIRLLGINAPEEGECWTDRSRAALESLVEGVVTVSGEERDQFGRRLAYIQAGATGVNAALVRGGHAIATSGHTRAVEFVAAEDDAYDAGNGLWSPTACGPAPSAAPAIRDVVFDAPGPDDIDPNGEYVVLGNDGEPADLTGWRIRDESSTHRFTFPEGFSLGRGETVVIRSGCGGDTPGELHWCADGPVWSNGGDMALLLDPAGNVVARLRY